MKKLLGVLATVFFLALLSGGYFIFDRWSKNPEEIVPYPYEFSYRAPAMKPDAPILIVGDRMGSYFARFKEELAATISKNLDNIIKVQSIASPGLGLHRTLHQLKSLSQWPQIVIYHGASEEFSEEKFRLSEIRKISENFRLYQDDRVHTALILYPWLSRLAYTPVARKVLKDIPELKTELPEKEYLGRLQTELLLFEEQLNQLVALARDRNSLLILTTTPINLDIAPKSVCSFSTTDEIEASVAQIKGLIERGDWKTAWQESQKATAQFAGNPRLFHLAGSVAKKLGKTNEAVNLMLQASSYECSAWRTTEVQNSIIRKVARNQQVLLFDFSRLVEKEWASNVTFFDDLHPQNIYYDKAMNQLGLAIRRILKL